MKYLIIILAISAIALSALAQDIKDPLPSIDINRAILDKTPQRFIKGFNSETIDRKLDSAMSFEFYNNLFKWETAYFPPRNYIFTNNQTLFVSNFYVGNASNGYSMLQAPAIEYSPALTYYKNGYNPQDFTPMTGDNLGRVYGFKKIRTDTVGTISGFEYHLDKTFCSGSDTVLSQPWPSDELIGMF